MRLIVIAALATSLSAAAQTSAPTQPAPPAQTAPPAHTAALAKPKSPVLHAPGNSAAPRGSVTKPVLPTPAIKLATTGTAKDAPITAASKDGHHAPVHHVAAKPGVRTAHAAKPPAPTAPAPPVVAAAPPQAAPFSQNPVMQLHGNARALLVFAPDTTNDALKEQYTLLASHVGDLSDRDVVMMQIVTLHHGADDVFAGENLPSGTYRDQLAARQKFAVKYNEFVVILVDENENEVFRSSTPMTMEDLDARLGDTKVKQREAPGQPQ